jgi:hypothetical protein
VFWDTARADVDDPRLIMARPAMHPLANFPDIGYGGTRPTDAHTPVGVQVLVLVEPQHPHDFGLTLASEAMVAHRLRAAFTTEIPVWCSPHSHSLSLSLSLSLDCSLSPSVQL